MKRKSANFLFISIAGLVLYALTLNPIGIAAAQQSQPGPVPDVKPTSNPAPVVPADNMTAAFNFQGQLKRNGVPVTANCIMTFTLWDAPTGGTHGGSQNSVVSVVGGAFSLQLNAANEFGALPFYGQARWLETTAQCLDDPTPTTLPRQALTAVPYAIGLIPGAYVGGDANNDMGAQFATHGVGSTGLLGIYAWGNTGLYGSGTAAGLFGESSSGDGVDGLSSSGYGLYGVSTSNIGVFGKSASGDGVDGVSTNGYGSYGFSTNNTGVFGKSTNGVGVNGVNTSGDGVKGNSSSGYGVEGISDTSYGVVGESTDTYGIYGTSQNSFGIVGASTNSIGVKGQSTYFKGVEGTSTNDDGVYGQGGNRGVYGWSDSGGGTVGSSFSGIGISGSSYTGWAGYFTGNVYVSGNLTVAGSKSGYVVDFALNADTASLQRGDLVAVVGSTTPLVGDIPMARVVRSDAAYQTGVVGVVDQFVIAGNPPKQSDAPIPPGQYLTVVTLGMFKEIMVDASYGAIQAGDLLVASPHAGYAMKASDRSLAVGAIVGKALDGLAAGSGVLPVIITLQ